MKVESFDPRYEIHNQPQELIDQWLRERKALEKYFPHLLKTVKRFGDGVSLQKKEQDD